MSTIKKTYSKSRDTIPARSQRRFEPIYRQIVRDNNFVDPVYTSERINSKGKLVFSNVATRALSRLCTNISKPEPVFDYEKIEVKNEDEKIYLIVYQQKKTMMVL
jgi:hypothetical protein